MTSAWELDIDEPDWLLTIVTRLLEAGVPPTAISKALDVEVDDVKVIQDDIRVRRYGTAELAEAMNFLIWRALEDTHAIIDTAPVDKRMRLNTTLLSRASAIVHGQQPDSMVRIQQEMADLTAEITGSPTGPSIYELNPVDAPPDDPEERPES